MRFLSFFLLISLFFVGCGGGGGGSVGLEPGSLEILLVDGPPDPSIVSVEVDIERVEADLSGHWIPLRTDAITIDLLEHQDVPALLASREVSNGIYRGIRFVISGARIADADGIHEAFLPLREITVEFPLTVSSERKNVLQLDFDAGESLLKVGPGIYELRPVIRAAVPSEVGSVSGVVQMSGSPVANVRVEAIAQNALGLAPGEVFARDWTSPDGSFRIWNLPPGTYDLRLTLFDRFGAALILRTLEDVIIERGEELETAAVDLAEEEN